MFDNGAIFQGVPPPESRKKLLETVRRIKDDYDKFVVPCAGRFAATITLINAGVSPDKIYTSDITLFSSALGYYLSDRPIADLNVEISKEMDWFGYKKSKTDLERTAKLLLTMKVLQVPPDSAYMKFRRQEYLDNGQKYVDQLQDKLLETYERCKGIHYEVKDLHVEFKENQDKKTFMFFNPPAFSKGYEKMFAFIGEDITWDEPEIEQFDHRDRFMFLTGQHDHPATIVSYHYVADILKEDKLAIPLQWNKLFCKKYPKYRRDYLITNKDLEHPRVLLRSDQDVKPSKYPQWCDDDWLNKKSKIQWVSLKQEEALYYRNLWIHRLGGTKSEAYYGCLVDGKLIGVMGFMLSSVFRDNRGYVHETFGMSVPSKRFKRLNRLLMRLMLSKEFREFLLAQRFQNMDLRDMNGVKTTCISRFPEVRLNNGIMKIVDREQMKDGRWKIAYYSDFHDKTFKATMIEYLLEEERYQKMVRDREVKEQIRNE